MPAKSRYRNDDALLALNLRRFCGAGSSFVIGEGAAGIGRSLMSAGINVLGTFDPGAITDEKALSSLPWPDNSFTTVILTGSFHDASGEVRLHLVNEANRLSSKYAVIVLIAQNADVLLQTETRQAWEGDCYNNGFRKHPHYYNFLNYTTLGSASRQIVIPLEKISKSALARYTIADLLAERSLHMDMLREYGSRSDAHVFRYAFATNSIRPGDRVLDAACGLGYGSHVMGVCSDAREVVGYDGSSFAVDYAASNYGDSESVRFVEGFLPDCLKDIPDNSFDCIVSFETLEHVADSHALLDEFWRLLTPGGRLIGSVPHDWTDETGQDPNAYHLQVFTFPSLVEQLEKNDFDIERFSAQTADRVKDLKGSPGSFLPRGRMLVDLEIDDVDQSLEAEWLLFVAAKSPRQGGLVPFEDHGFSQTEIVASGNAIDMSEYENPWIFKSIVWVGSRTANRALREKWALEIVRTASPLSPDLGAALCVLAYCYLDMDESVLPPDISEMIDDFILNSRRDSAACLRWRVSLCYVMALFCLHRGEREAAKRYFGDVVACPVMDYGVTLLTKPALAAYKLGQLYISENAPEKAREIWEAQYDRIKSDIASHMISKASGLPGCFEPFEISQTMGFLSNILGGLRALDRADLRPAIFEAETHRDFTAIVDEKQRELDVSEQAKLYFEAQYKEQLAAIHGKDRWIQELVNGKDWFESQLVSSNEWNAELLAGKDWLDARVESLDSALREKDATIERLTAENKAAQDETDRWIDELVKGKEWLESQLAATKDWNAELVRGKDWLSERVAALEEAIQEKDLHIEQMIAQSETAQIENSRWIEELMKGKDWFESQFAATNDWNAELQRGKDYLDERVASLDRQLGNKDVEIENLEMEKLRLGGEIELLRQQLKYQSGLAEDRAKWIRQLERSQKAFRAELSNPHDRQSGK